MIWRLEAQNQGQLLLRSARENLFHSRLSVLQVASNPWASFACRCFTLISAFRFAWHSPREPICAQIFPFFIKTPIILD